MEGNSYYFCYKMCLAFREKGNPIVFVRGKKYTLPPSAISMVEALGHSSELKFMQKKEFDCALNSTYSKSLIRGVSRVGLDRFFKTDKKTKRSKNVKNIFNE
jgi:hypothetical protein